MIQLTKGYIDNNFVLSSAAFQYEIMLADKGQTLEIGGSGSTRKTFRGTGALLHHQINAKIYKPKIN